MPINNPIKTPAGYVPAFALGFSGPEGELEIVESTKPLPVTLASSDPLAVLPGYAPAPAPNLTMAHFDAPVPASFQRI